MILGLCRAAGVRLFVTGGLIAVGLSIATSGAQALDVQITGAMPDDLAAKVRASSLLVEQTTDDIADLPAQIVAAAQADYRRILAVLYNAGYFGGVVQITLDGREAAGFATVGNVPDVARAVIVVDPRQQFRLSRATITPIANGTELPQGFAKGEIARLSTLRETAAAGVDGWRNQGHAKAALARQDLTADHRTGQLAADLGIAPGPQLRFGPLVLRNPSAVRTDRIRDIAGLPTGTVFSPEEIALAEGRLRRAGAFRSVSLTEAETIGPENTLPIEAILTDAPPRRFGFGAEIATLDGLTLSGFWLHRNLLGGSERLRVEGEIAGIGGQTGGEDFRFAARFGRPATFNEDTDFYALAEIEQRNDISFSSRRIEIEAGIERIASPERTYTVGLGLRRSLTSDAFGATGYTLITLPLTARFDYRETVLNPIAGFYAEAALTPFTALSGTDDGLRATADVRYYRTFGEDGPLTLAARGQFGSLTGPSLARAPADMLFYSGGGGTVRGHSYQSLGVPLVGGGQTGGRSFVGASLEARYQGAGNLGYVAFWDVAYIGANSLPDGSGSSHSGAGLGLRYNTGIGPIRLDVAVPTTGRGKGDNVQIYVGIGQSF